MQPNPPLIAISFAIFHSVTVSIGELTIGIFNGTFLENFVETLHSILELMSEY